MKISTRSDHVNSVRKQVAEAFALTTKPADNNLVVSADALNAPAAERMRQRLTGKRWQELDRAFLEKAWAAFCYLTAEAYRYILPSLLIRCLEDFAQHNDLLHPTIHTLTPSYRSIYYEGKDARFDYQISALTRVQYDAVCAFLSLIFDRIPAYRYNSAQALRWGWSRHETAAVQKCKKYYDVLHHYEYPPVRGKKKGALVATIRRAFGQTPYPGDTNLSGSDQGDEPAECALELRGVSWKTVHPHLLAFNFTALSFLTDEGFRYFLPAYLIADLMEKAGEADCIFHLTHGFREEDRTKKDTDWRGYAEKRFSVFTPGERSAIIAYLKYIASQAADPSDIQQALTNYWSAPGMQPE